MSKKILLFGIISLLAFTGSLFAQTVVKDDFRVNDDFTIGGSNQRMPAVAMDHEGNFVVVWLDERNGGIDIYAQKYDRSGNPLGENFQVNDAWREDLRSSYDLKVAMDAKGDFVVVWMQYKKNKTDVCAQRYNHAGNPIGGNFTVNEDSAWGNRSSPDVAMNASGEFVIVWKGYEYQNGSLYGQRYSSSGETVGTNFKIVSSDMRKIDYFQPSVAIDAKGEFVMAWTEVIHHPETNWTQREIHSIRVNAKNEILGSDFKVNDSDSLASPAVPDVAINAPGNFVITWLENRQGYFDIYGQRYSSKGEPLGPNFKANEVTGRLSKAFGPPKVALNMAKKFTIAWFDSRYGRSGIYLQDYDQFGEPEGGNLKVADIGYKPSNNFDITKTPSGNLALTWDESGCANDMDIFAMLLDQKAEVLKEKFKVEDDLGSSLQGNPAVAAGSSKVFMISWDDFRLCGLDVFAQLFNSSGEAYGDNFRVNQESGGGRVKTQVSVSMDSSGNSVISYLTYAIFLRRYDRNGEALGDNILVNENNTQYWGYDPDVCVSPRGDFVVAWSGRKDPRSSVIFAQLYEASGNRTGTNFMVNSVPDSNVNSEHPKVARCSSGDFVVVWQNYSRVDFSYIVEIWGQLFDSTGKAVGENFKISDSDYSIWNTLLDVGMDKQGNFVVAWYWMGNIWVQRFKKDGLKIGSSLKAMDSSWKLIGKFSLWVEPTGEFLVCWDDSRNGNPDIYAQRFDSQGNPLGGNFRVNSDQGDNTQMSPAVAADDKNYYFTWVDNTNTGSGFDIFAKIISFEQTSVSEQEVSGRPELSLLQNYPNPFNPSTTIPFRAGSREQVAGSPIHTSLKIYNILGQLVRTMVDEDKMPGNYQVVWDGKNDKGHDVSSGVYFYVIKAKDFVQTRKMTLVR